MFHLRRAACSTTLNDGTAASAGYRHGQLHHQRSLAGDRGPIDGYSPRPRVRLGDYAGGAHVWPTTDFSRHRLQVGVRAFLKIVPVLAWGADAADYYADIRHQLTSAGQPIGDMDMMIAAHALALGAVLVTNNTRHFGRIVAPLVLVNWREGVG